VPCAGRPQRRVTCYGWAMRRLVLVAIIVVLGFGIGLELGLGARTAAAEPPMTTRKVEVLQHRPSGFWTSNRPATGGAYRWRLLGIGVVLASGAGLLMWRLTRRANAERVARTKAP
jgi:hypothetical protein